LKFLGEASVSWYERRNEVRYRSRRGRRSFIRYFTSKEEYFKNIKNKFFLEGAENGENVEMNNNNNNNNSYTY